MSFNDLDFDIQLKIYHMVADDEERFIEQFRDFYLANDKYDDIYDYHRYHIYQKYYDNHPYKHKKHCPNYYIRKFCHYRVWNHNKRECGSYYVNNDKTEIILDCKYNKLTFKSKDVAYFGKFGNQVITKITQYTVCFTHNCKNKVMKQSIFYELNKCNNCHLSACWFYQGHGEYTLTEKLKNT